MVVDKTDLQDSFPSSSSYTQVATGDTVTAQVENANNNAWLTLVTILYNYCIDQTPQIGEATTYTALQSFSAGLKTDAITAYTTNGDLVLSKNGTGLVKYDGTGSTNEIANKAYVTAALAAAATVVGLIMTGANGTTAGTQGAVPAPAATDNTKFLRGDATFVDIAALTQTLTNKTFDANATGNTLSNVEVADIASSAKVGAGTKLVLGTTVSGTGTASVTATGTLTSGDVASWDANGNAIASGTQVSAIPNIVRAYKTADQTITTTTYTNSTSLSIVLKANKNYKIFYDISMTNGTTAGMHVRCTIDGSTSFDYGQYYAQSYPKVDGTSTITRTASGIYGANSDVPIISSSTAVASTDFLISGYTVILNSGSDRTFKIQFKQETATSTLTMNKGSVLYAIEM